MPQDFITTLQDLLAELEAQTELPIIKIDQFFSFMHLSDAQRRFYQAEYQQWRTDKISALIAVMPEDVYMSMLAEPDASEQTIRSKLDDSNTILDFESWLETFKKKRIDMR